MNERANAAPPVDPAWHANLFASDHLSRDIGRRSLHGAALTLGAQLVKFVLQIGSTFLLARLLAPADFGMVAMVTAITGGIALFKDAGLSLATVQSPSITAGQISNLFWANVAISVLLLITTAALAPLIAHFYSEPRLAALTLAIGGGFLVSGLAVQHQALLRRQMRFTTLAIIDIGAMAAGVGAAVAAAMITGSYWALIVAPLGTAVVTTTGVWLACPWLPGWPQRGTNVRPLLRFGGTVAACNVVNYVARNVDNVLAGWWLGATALGFYSKAYALLLLPINQINMPFSSVMIPALSRLQHDLGAFRQLYLDTIALIAWLGMPAIVFLAIHAEVVVGVVLGPQWAPAVPIFQLLAPAAVMAATNVAGSWAVVPMGRADKELKLSLVTAPSFAAAIAAGLTFGIEGVAIAVSVSRVALKLPALAYCYAGTPLRVVDFLGAVAAPTAVCLALVAIDRGSAVAGFPPWAGVAAEIGMVGAAFYCSNASRRLRQLALQHGGRGSRVADGAQAPT